MKAVVSFLSVCFMSAAALASRGGGSEVVGSNGGARNNVVGEAQAHACIVSKVDHLYKEVNSAYEGPMRTLEFDEARANPSCEKVRNRAAVIDAYNARELRKPKYVQLTTHTFRCVENAFNDGWFRCESTHALRNTSIFTSFASCMASCSGYNPGGVTAQLTQ